MRHRMRTVTLFFLLALTMTVSLIVGRTNGFSAALPVPAAPQEQAPAAGVGIPAGTVIAVRTIDAIDSQKARTGQTFHASLDEPISVNRQLVAPKGADVLLKLVSLKQSGKITGAAELTLAVDSLVIQGNWIAVSTDEVTSSSENRKKKSAKVIGGSAVVGAVLGGIFGGARGALAGATAGAGAGTAVQMATKGQRVFVPSETRLSFRVSSPDQTGPAGPESTQPAQPPLQPTRNSGQDRRQPVAPPAAETARQSTTGTPQQSGAIQETATTTPTSVPATNVSGTWNMSRSDGGSTITETLTLQQDGNAVSGTLEGNDLIRTYKAALEGTVRGDQIQFTVHFSNGAKMFAGTIAGARMRGDRPAQWSAMRPLRNPGKK